VGLGAGLDGCGKSRPPSEASTPWNPQDLSRPVQEFLTFTFTCGFSGCGLFCKRPTALQELLLISEQEQKDVVCFVLFVLLLFITILILVF
jgi:hypothetical protein